MPIIGFDRYHGISLVSVEVEGEKKPTTESEFENKAERFQGIMTTYNRKSYSVLLDDPEKPARTATGEARVTGRNRPAPEPHRRTPTEGHGPVISRAAIGISTSARHPAGFVSIARSASRHARTLLADHAMRFVETSRVRW